MGIWEQMHNPNFNMVEFDQFRTQAGVNSFVMSPEKWIKSTGAIGIRSKSGRYGGGTFAHRDIAFEFASWISPETDAIQAYLIPPYISKQSMNILYATEADILNMALFGKTAKGWRDENPNKDGNIRDYADVTQLVVLANLEGINAHLIKQNISQSERLSQLNQIAISQMESLVGNPSIKGLDPTSKKH